MLGEPFTLPSGKHKEDWTQWRAEVQLRQDAVAKLAAKYHPTYACHQLMADEWVRTVQAFWPK